jgi:GR25 family glycosyltransferase involved in LPS biosynthesis
VDLDIVVVASPHRPPLITDALRGVPHRVVLGPDEALPPHVSPAREAGAVYIKNPVGAFRCFRGHQVALTQPLADHILVLEDDAVPNRADWMNVVEHGRCLLDRFDVVSLHGREIRGIDAQHVVGGTTFVSLAPVIRRRLFRRYELRWVQGSLAYLITATAARRFAEAPYRGIPVDHLLANDFLFAVATASPFDHDRRHGSLVEHPR